MAVLPLDMRVVNQYGDALAKLRTELGQLGLQYKVDDSGASIGRRAHSPHRHPGTRSAPYTRRHTHDPHTLDPIPTTPTPRASYSK